MKVPVAVSIILIVFLAGCTSQVAKTGNIQENPSPVETKKSEPILKPQLTSAKGAGQEAEISTGTEINVTKAPQESTPSEPKTFQVNVVQGVGISTGAG